MTRKTALLGIALLTCGCATMAQSTTPAPVAPKAAPHQPGVPAKTPPAQATTAKPASGKMDPAKEAAIRHLMELTQASKLGDNINVYIANQVQGGLKQAQAMPAEKLPQFMSAFNQKLAAAAPPSAVVTAMVPVYDRLLSLEDIQALNQFYESPLGQRALKALPQVVTETENIATQMQQRAALAVLQGMTDEYPELKAMMGGPGAGGAGAGAPGAAPGAPAK
jgi:hypothetical protein